MKSAPWAPRARRPPRRRRRPAWWCIQLPRWRTRPRGAARPLRRRLLAPWPGRNARAHTQACGNPNVPYTILDADAVALQLALCVHPRRHPMLFVYAKSSRCFLAVPAVFNTATFFYNQGPCAEAGTPAAAAAAATGAAAATRTRASMKTLAAQVPAPASATPAEPAPAVAAPAPVPALAPMSMKRRGRAEAQM